MRVVKVRNLTIGEGRPKICVPIVGVTKQEILSQAEKLREVPAEIVEWRADWFEGVRDMEQVKDVLRSLWEVLGELPLLFTFRTKAEGGEKEIDEEAYRALNLAVIQSGGADLVDVEIFRGEACAKEIIEEAHVFGVHVIASNHDFAKTPEKEEIIRRLRYMQEMDADILKIAVMPNSKKDVLTLLAATEEMSRKYADRPLVTMSMGGDGAISRMGGEIFGSAITFGTAGQASAPGQMEAKELKKVLDMIHKVV